METEVRGGAEEGGWKDSEAALVPVRSLNGRGKAGRQEGEGGAAPGSSPVVEMWLDRSPLFIDSLLREQILMFPSSWLGLGLGRTLSNFGRVFFTLPCFLSRKYGIKFDNFLMLTRASVIFIGSGNVGMAS